MTVMQFTFKTTTSCAQFASEKNENFRDKNACTNL